MPNKIRSIKDLDELFRLTDTPLYSRNIVDLNLEASLMIKQAGQANPVTATILSFFFNTFPSPLSSLLGRNFLTNTNVHQGICIPSLKNPSEGLSCQIGEYQRIDSTACLEDLGADDHPYLYFPILDPPCLLRYPLNSEALETFKNVEFTPYLKSCCLGVNK